MTLMELPNGTLFNLEGKKGLLAQPSFYLSNIPRLLCLNLLYLILLSSTPIGMTYGPIA
jgi:hypothetical protein